MSQRRITINITIPEISPKSSDTKLVDNEWCSPEFTGNERWRFSEPEYPGPGYGPFDPWELRSQFLGWDLRMWNSFFFMAGEFPMECITRNDFEEWQRLLRKSLLMSSRDWTHLHDEFDPAKVDRLTQARIRYDFTTQPPTASLVGLSCLDLMIASIQLDKLQGAEFRACARHDCVSPPFEVGTRQKIYCKTDCAHLVAVRNSRARAYEERARTEAKAPKRPRKS